MPFDPYTNPLNSEEWVFPTLKVIHISCFALSVGLISAVNLQLAGALSFVLWFAIVAFGRCIAYNDRPDEARIQPVHITQPTVILTAIERA